MKTSFLISGKAMRCRLLLTLGFGLFSAVGAWAQRYTPPAIPPFPNHSFPNYPTRKGPVMPLPGKGSYQTLDSVWHKARISFQTAGIRVDDLNEATDPEVAAPLVPLEQVRCIVVRHDTLAFRLLEDPDKASAKPEYEYLKQLYRGGGWTVYPGLLKHPDGEYIVIPSRKDDFQQVMLQYFGDCTPLRKQIEQDIFDVNSTPGIVRQYVQCKLLPTNTGN